jgi:putative flippase GtrA
VLRAKVLAFAPVPLGPYRVLSTCCTARITWAGWRILAVKASFLHMENSSNVPKALMRQILGFAGIGAIATALQYGILVIAVEIFRMNAIVGSSLGFVLSAAVNYQLNYRFTFRSEKSHVAAASRFALIACAGLAINSAMMMLLIDVLRLRYLVAQVATTCVVFAWNFCGNAFWSFARSRT